MAKRKDKNIFKKAEEDMSKKKHEETPIPPPEAEQIDPQASEIGTEGETEATTDPTLSLKAELDQLNDKFLRLNAEYQNYRKRVEKEKSDIFKYGNEKLFVEMLPIMDNFERAISASEQEASENKVLDGVKLIKKSFDELFERNGVMKIDALGQTFDPIKHHAVMTVESENEEKDQVIEVYQDGYALNDRVIRPSMVKVSH